MLPIRAPAGESPSVPLAPTATITLTVNGISSSPFTFPVTQADPRSFVTPGSWNPTFREFAAAALNADGTVNSASNPAKVGSVISVFVNGLANPHVGGLPDLITGAGWSVTNVALAGPFVLDVNLRVPTTTANMECPAPNTSACEGSFAVQDISAVFDTFQTSGSVDVGFAGLVYAAP